MEPLFLDELKETLDQAFNSVSRLEKLLDRIGEIKVFDPACGSGNFLVIAYKELRRLEHAILERLGDLSVKHQRISLDSRINIENFYGIEIDDFAVEVAILSLWIAKHQMNAEFYEKFNLKIELIPLKEAGRIVQGNATRVDWNLVCPNDGGEIYLIGNPPYVGSTYQTPEQKSDFSFVFGVRPYSKLLDYIALWFIKGADYIRGTQAKLALVTTNSVSQGQHVELMFPRVFEMGIEIGFAYTSFKWENNAKRNAGVTVAVIGLRNQSSDPKYIFTDAIQIAARNINGYLADAPNIVATKRSKPLAPVLPPMIFGSKPTDGGHLIMAPDERDELLELNPASSEFIKKYTGADDFINARDRYCIWVESSSHARAEQFSELRKRFDAVRIMRLASKDASTRNHAEMPYRFQAPRYKPTASIIVPRVSSERRAYVPIGYLDAGYVINDQAFAVYDAEPWVFALLTSRMHMTWTRAVGGQMETRLRYSNTIVYNNFPAPTLSDATEEKLTVAALRVLDVREYHCEKTLAELYDPDSMPNELRAAHTEVDDLVDSIYSKKPYETDEQRLSDLFAMYERMTAEEAAKAPVKKTRASRKAVTK